MNVIARTTATMVVPTIHVAGFDPVSIDGKNAVNASSTVVATVAAVLMDAIRKTWFAPEMLRVSNFADVRINCGGASSIMLLSLPLLLPSMPLS